MRWLQVTVPPGLGAGRQKPSLVLQLYREAQRRSCRRAWITQGRQRSISRKKPKEEKAGCCTELPCGFATLSAPWEAWPAPGLSPIGLCPLEAVQGRTKQGGGEGGSGVMWPCVRLIKCPDTYQGLPGLHPPLLPPGPMPTADCPQPSWKGSLAESHPFPHVQTPLSVSSFHFLGVSCFMWLHDLGAEAYLSRTTAFKQVIFAGILCFCFK